jgi:hypothetical protein
MVVGIRKGRKKVEDYRSKVGIKGGSVLVSFRFRLGNGEWKIWRRKKTVVLWIYRQRCEDGRPRLVPFRA